MLRDVIFLRVDRGNTSVVVVTNIEKLDLRLYDWELAHTDVSGVDCRLDSGHGKVAIGVRRPPNLFECIDEIRVL